MNARFGFLSPAVALFAIGCLVAPASKGSLANGGFESGLDGWTSGGNVTVESKAPYAPTEGAKLVAFSAKNLAPNGWISQAVDIPNSNGRYHRLRFDVGNLGFISAEVRVRIEITEIGFGAPVPRVNEEITVLGITGGATRWQQAAYDFPTPVTGQVLVKLTDVSSETISTDLVVDNLRIDDSVRVDVTSSDDWPNPGIDISVSPASIEGWTNSHTPATFNHHRGTTLTLTAPAFANLKPFVLWRKNGVDYGNDPVTTVTLNEEFVTMVAVYDPPLALHLNSPAEARGFMGTGPFDHLSWSGYIQNGTGAAEDWSASAVLPDGSTDPVFFKVIPSHGRLETYNSAMLRVCLTAEALKLPAGTHYGRVDVSSRFSTASTGIVLTVIDPNQHVENGSFESGFDDGWSPLHHITLESGLPYTATDGSKLVAFNAHEATPNGTLSRAFATEANVTYRVHYDVGTLSYNTAEQRIEVAVANTGEPPFDIQTRILHGIGGGNCDWERRQFSFVAHGDSTTISFRDVSPTTNSIDLLLDHVRVTNPGFGITVTTLADENDATPGSGTGDSLREAIAWANASPGTNAITFAPALDHGLITLNGTQLSTTLPLAIDASALPSGITVSAGGQSRVMELGEDATLKNLQIRGGNTPSDQSGGGILNHANLLLAGVTVTSNRSSAAAGGILNVGDLSAANCNLTDNFSMLDGAALHNEGGTTLLENSVVSGNLAFGNGGGLTCRGLFGSAWTILSGSTISNNAATGSGGGYSGTNGYKAWGILYGENSTFSENSSDSAGGAIYGNIMVDLTHCTVSGNNAATEGGGIAGAWLQIGNSIVAGNTAPASPDLACYNVQQEGQNLLSGNPALAPLADFGGATPTMLPLPGSPVIDAAVVLPGTPAIDQRGCPRPSGPLPDIGAVEATPFCKMELVDTDHDLIDDRLEPAYQMTVGIDDSGRDSDGDGSSDAEELANMTDPLDSSSLLRILSFTKAPDFDAVTNPVFDISFASFPGLSYSVECDQNLDFTSPACRFRSLGTAGGFTGSARIPLEPDRDFVRVRRDP